MLAVSSYDTGTAFDVVVWAYPLFSDGLHSFQTFTIALGYVRSELSSTWSTGFRSTQANGSKLLMLMQRPFGEIEIPSNSVIE